MLEEKGEAVKAPAECTVGEVLRATEGSLAPVSCLADRSKVCERKAECRTLPMWEGLDRVVTEYLGRFTIQDLMRKETDGFDYVI